MERGSLFLVATKKLATELRNLGTEADFVLTDVRHEEEVKDLVEKMIAGFGRLDIVVNNAGTVGTPGSAAAVRLAAGDISVRTGISPPPTSPCSELPHT